MDDQLIHHKRQFLAPERSRYDEGSCQSHITLHDYEEEGVFFTAELLVSDGHNTLSFWTGVSDDEYYDDFLSIIRRLRDHISEFCAELEKTVEKVKASKTLTG